MVATLPRRIPVPPLGLPMAVTTGRGDRSDRRRRPAIPSVSDRPRQMPALSGHASVRPRSSPTTNP